ncbi:MAG: hypothetical protein KBA46_04110 [Candidatus Omnitrophica bacterium]|nr:hypothetical protein [Candidatus Omnitrophota bacterium]
MAKEKINILRSFLHFFTTHPWIKLISLGLAIVVWFYVAGEIHKFNY